MSTADIFLLVFCYVVIGGMLSAGYVDLRNNGKKEFTIEDWFAAFLIWPLIITKVLLMGAFLILSWLAKNTLSSLARSLRFMDPRSF